MLKVYLNKSLVFINPPVKDRKELFSFLGAKAKATGYINDDGLFAENLEKREQKESNIIRSNIAIPHTRNKDISHQFAGICVFTEGLGYSDNEEDPKVNIVFFVGSRKDEPSYLSLFADISLLLMKEDFRNALLEANVPEDILHTVSKHTIQETALTTQAQKRYKVVLVVHREIDTEILLEVLMECRIKCLMNIHGDNFMKKNMKKIPFLMGVARTSKKETFQSEVIMGVTEDKEAANKLYLLLKNQGIDLKEPGMGVLYMTEILVSFGGIDEDWDF